MPARSPPPSPPPPRTLFSTPPPDPTPPWPAASIQPSAEQPLPFLATLPARTTAHDDAHAHPPLRHLHLPLPSPSHRHAHHRYAPQPQLSSLRAAPPPPPPPGTPPPAASTSGRLETCSPRPVSTLSTRSHLTASTASPAPRGSRRGPENSTPPESTHTASPHTTKRRTTQDDWEATLRHLHSQQQQHTAAVSSSSFSTPSTAPTTMSSHPPPTPEFPLPHGGTQQPAQIHPSLLRHPYGYGPPPTAAPHPSHAQGMPGYPTISPAALLQTLGLPPPPEEMEDDDDEGGSEDDDDDTSEAGSTSKRRGSTAGGAAKKRKVDEKGKGKATNGDAGAQDGEAPPKKEKQARGARACLVCRKVKMRCIGADDPPCKRCRTGGHECIFEESNRGKRSSKKTEAMAASLRKMEKTLDTVLRSISHPGFAGFNSGMLTRSPTPEPEHAHLHAPPPHAQLPPLSMASPIPRSSSSSSRPSGAPPGTSSNDPLESLAANRVPLNPTGAQTLERLMSGTPGPPGGSGPGSGAAPTPMEHLVSAAAASPAPSPPHRPRSPRLHSLPDNTLNPLGLLAEASLRNRRSSMRASVRPASVGVGSAKDVGQAGSGASPAGTVSGAQTAQDGEESVVKEEEADAIVAERNSGGVGVASQEYYRPGPMSMLPLRRIFIERQVQPEILSFLTSENVGDLFQIYFSHINIHCGLLEREFHTPQLVCSRSPFLLTAICAVSSKFYDKHPELQPKLNAAVRKAAFDVPSQGFKSVEIVLAYLLLVMWGIGPSRRFEEDKTWLLLGLAIRVATDLNLHRKSVSPIVDGADAAAREREIRIRERAWLMCYIQDRSVSAQMGKPSSISMREDYIVRNAQSWAVGYPADTGVAGYCELQRIVSRSIDFIYSGTSTVSGLVTDCNYLLVTSMFEAQLTEWREKTAARLASGELDALPQEVRDYLNSFFLFYYNYWSLAIFSFGLQHALEISEIDLPYFFSKCYGFATAVLTIAKEELAPRGWLRYSTDAHFVFITYACVSLLKFIRPQFRKLHSEAAGVTEESIMKQVTEMADLLAKIAVDPHHTPALYSAFLRALLSAPHDGTPTRPPSPHPMSRPTTSTAATSASAATAGAADGAVPQTTAQPAPAPAAAGVEDILAGFQGLEGVAFPGGAATNGAAPGQVDGFGQEGSQIDFMPMDLSGLGDQAAAMDALFQNGFWENVLLPGFGGPLDSLSGGVMRSGYLTPRFATPGGTPRPSRAGSPVNTMFPEHHHHQHHQQHHLSTPGQGHSMHPPDNSQYNHQQQQH